MKVGFVGLGMMGKFMAANLQENGFDLVVHDLNKAPGLHGLTRLKHWVRQWMSFFPRCLDHLKSKPLRWVKMDFWPV